MSIVFYTIYCLLLQAVSKFYMTKKALGAIKKLIVAKKFN